MTYKPNMYNIDDLLKEKPEEIFLFISMNEQELHKLDFNFLLLAEVAYNEAHHHNNTQWIKVVIKCCQTLRYISDEQNRLYFFDREMLARLLELKICKQYPINEQFTQPQLFIDWFFNSIIFPFDTTIKMTQEWRKQNIDIIRYLFRLKKILYYIKQLQDDNIINNNILLEKWFVIYDMLDNKSNI